MTIVFNMHAMHILNGDLYNSHETYSGNRELNCITVMNDF